MLVNAVVLMVSPLNIYQKIALDFLNMLEIVEIEMRVISRHLLCFMPGNFL